MIAKRELTGHIVNPANDQIQILVLDDPGPGGAHHSYYVHVKESSLEWPLVFQKGAINEVGVNGLTHEALLAVLVDRLECFQKGPYACRENAIALTHLQDAQHWLQHRTRARMARGVEGTMKV